MIMQITMQLGYSFCFVGVIDKVIVRGFIPFLVTFYDKRHPEFQLAVSVAVGHFPSYMRPVPPPPPPPGDINTCIGDM